MKVKYVYQDISQFPQLFTLEFESPKKRAKIDTDVAVTDIMTFEEGKDEKMDVEQDKTEGAQGTTFSVQNSEFPNLPFRTKGN